LPKLNGQPMLTMLTLPAKQPMRQSRSFESGLSDPQYSLTYLWKMNAHEWIQLMACPTDQLLWPAPQTNFFGLPLHLDCHRKAGAGKLVINSTADTLPKVIYWVNIGAAAQTNLDANLAQHLEEQPLDAMSFNFFPAGDMALTTLPRDSQEASHAAFTPK